MWSILLLAGLAAADPRLLADGYTASKTIFGGDVFSKELNEVVYHSVVHLPHSDTVKESLANILASPKEEET